MNITFIGSIQTSYKRGKDKTKRKSRGLLSTGIAATTGGLLGAKVGSELAQTGLFIDHIKRKYKRAGKPLQGSFGKPYSGSLLEKGMMHKVMREGVQVIRNGGATDKTEIKAMRRTTRLLNKAAKRGGIRGAVVGAGLAGGTALAINKFRNRKDK